MSGGKYVLVITEGTAVKKKKVIESILSKFINDGAVVAEPIDGQTDTVREWCLSRAVTYTVVDDSDGDYVEWCDYGIFFAEGPTKESCMSKHRQAFALQNKIAFVIEVNVESKNRVQESRGRRTSSRSKRS